MAAVLHWRAGPLHDVRLTECTQQRYYRMTGSQKPNTGSQNSPLHVLQCAPFLLWPAGLLNLLALFNWAPGIEGDHVSLWPVAHHNHFGKGYCRDNTDTP